jgi:hypothetical protein
VKVQRAAESESDECRATFSGVGASDKPGAVHVRFESLVLRLAGIAERETNLKSCRAALH